MMKRFVPDIHFISINPSFIEATKECFGNTENITYTVGNVQDMSRIDTAFISPANSFGFMDGGIDYVYSRVMFPGIEKQVKDNISRLGFKTDLGRNYLPVGSGMVINTCPYTCLVVVPTMFLPHDVSKTRNAYHAFMAALHVLEKMHKDNSSIHILACPALCCGYGKMTYEDSATQIYQAFIEYKNGYVLPEESNYKMIQNVYIGPNRDNEQPDNYDNREIKQIDLALL